MPSGPSLTRFPGRYVTTARQVEPHGAKQTMRRLGVSSLAAMSSLTGRLRSALARPRVQVFTLRHVLDDEQVPFRVMLRTLAKHHRFVPYGEAVDLITSTKIDEPIAAITIDTGQRSSMQAARILEEHGIHACFFVCPAMIGLVDYHRVRAFCVDRLHIPPVQLLSWPELESLVERGHEVGSLGMEHVDLAAVEPERAHDEIAGSRELLEQRIGPVRHFAWPYGGFENITREIADCVYECGYESCASTVRGAHGPDARHSGNPCIRRDAVLAAWPPSHALYFAACNAERLAPDSGEWTWPT